MVSGRAGYSSVSRVVITEAYLPYSTSLTYILIVSVSPAGW